MSYAATSQIYKIHIKNENDPPFRGAGGQKAGNERQGGEKAGDERQGGKNITPSSETPSEF